MKLKGAIGLLASLATTGALAVPITDIHNVRPVAVGTGSEITLDAALDYLFGDVPHLQNTAGVYSFATGSATSIPTLILEQTAHFTTQKFGMWFGTDTSNILRVALFDGSAGVGANSGVGGGPDTGAAAGIKIVGNTLTVGNPFGDTGVVTGVYTDTRISQNFFGFYFQTGNSIAYTLDLLNSGAPRVLAYNQDSNFAFGYEDYTDNDYQDMVVKVESIRPVPLPGTLALLSLGLVGAGFLRRRSI
jgi:PEP-CTERM motif